MGRYFLGVDVGNTKSHAMICDDQGRLLALAHGSQGNHEVVGREGLTATLHAIVDDALRQAGLHAFDIAGAGYGIAGFDWECDRPLHDEVIGEVGPPCPYLLVNDAVLGLVAGTTEGWGVVVSAGTSCNARGRDRQGREGRVTGNGAWFGEYGGGIELVYKGLEMVSRAWSLRGPQTTLTEKYVACTGAADVTDMLEGLARGRYHLRATDAPLVFQAADEGDAVARQAIVWLAQELTSLAVGIARQLHFEGTAFELVLAGSLYRGTPLIHEVILSEVRQVAPLAELRYLDAPPVVGGVFLGMECAGVAFAAIRQHIIEQARQRLYVGS